MLRFLTSGESHGEELFGILEGLPSGLKVKKVKIDEELVLRQSGYGRGKRMQIEKDRCEIISGIRNDITTGAPIALRIKNKDFSIDRLPQVTCPRPGHADLAGALKYNHKDIRDVLERSSARETAMRVAIGSISKILLEKFDIEFLSHVIMLGGVKIVLENLSFDKIKSKIKKSNLRCIDKDKEKLMIKAIDKASSSGDTSGGTFEVRIKGVMPGLGSYVQYDRRLDGLLAKAVMSIQSAKAVEIGEGVTSASKKGSEVHDEIFYKKDKGFYRITNNAGGIEGGVSNGEEIIVRGYVKPIATLTKPLKSVDIRTKKQVKATVERTDICVVPAAGIVAESVCAFELARVFLEKFGGDSMGEIHRNYEGYVKQIVRF